MILRAPCKINLGLDVLRRRPDGFHELRTLFLAVSHADDLEVFAHPRGEADALSIEGPESAGIDAGPANLVLRGVEGLRGWMRAGGLGREAGPLRIRLVKRIPHGAGLGGGSSDAAAALRAARETWRAPAGDAELARLAAGIGSDCPFFVRGGAAMATGRGEVLVEVPVARELAVLVAKPPCAVPTRGAYAGLDPARDFGDRTDFDGMLAWLRGGVGGPPVPHNAFTRSVAEAFPEVAATLRALGGCGALAVQMSGSGSACFAVFDDPEEAERAARRVALPEGSRVFVAHPEAAPVSPGPA